MELEHESEKSVDPQGSFEHLIGSPFEIDFLSALAVGSIILSFDQIETNVFRIKLTGDCNIFIYQEGGEVGVSLHTGREYDSLPLHISKESEVYAGEIADLIHSISLLHTIIMSIKRGREDILRKALLLNRGKFLDLVLPASDRMRLVSLGAGSIIAQITAISEEAIDNAIMLILILTPGGRDQILKRQEMKAKRNQAIAEKLTAEAKEADAKSDKTNAEALKTCAEAAKIEAEARKIRAEAIMTEIDAQRKFVQIYNTGIAHLDTNDPLKIAFHEAINKQPQFQGLISQNMWNILSSPR